MTESQTATTGKSVTLRYSAESFDQYYKQLKALCLKSRGSWILTKLVVDPISEFLDQQLLQIGDEETPSENSTSVTETSNATACSGEQADRENH